MINYTNSVFYVVLLMLTSSSRHFARAFRQSISRSQQIGLRAELIRRFASNNDVEDVEIHTADALPSSFNSKFLQTLLERGFIHQCTDFKTLDEKLNSGVVRAYLGFDATASSLHVGSLLQIMILRHLQKSGHKPIVLIGGGTTKVGDPTGKVL